MRHPLVKGDRTSSVVTKARAITDADAKAFDEAVERMPQTPGLLRRVELVRTGEKQIAPYARTPSPPG